MRNTGISRLQSSTLLLRIILVRGQIYTRAQIFLGVVSIFLRDIFFKHFPDQTLELLLSRFRINTRVKFFNYFSLNFWFNFIDIVIWFYCFFIFLLTCGISFLFLRGMATEFLTTFYRKIRFIHFF